LHPGNSFSNTSLSVPTTFSQALTSTQLDGYDRRYDTTEELNVKCDQLDLAPVARKKCKKRKKLKQTKRQCPLSSVQVQDPWRRSGRN